MTTVFDKQLAQLATKSLSGPLSRREQAELARLLEAWNRAEESRADAAFRDSAPDETA